MRTDDYAYIGLVLAFLFLVLMAILIFATPAGASSDTVLTPGRIMAASCADFAVMPIINWTAKGSMQIVELHQAGNCRLSGEFNASGPGLYCTGIGVMDGHDWIPDECVTVTAMQERKVNKNRTIWKYRYQP